MAKKILTLIQAIIQIIAIVFLFIPGVFAQDVFISHLNGSAPITKLFPDSAFEAANISNSHAGVVLTLIFFIINLVYFVICFATNLAWIKKKYMIALPSASIVPIIISAITITSYKYEYQSDELYSMSYVLYWGFYVISALAVIIIALELFKQLSKIPEVKEKVSATETAKTSLEDVEKLKDLLDKGIISEEEFEAKKKQLLGL